MPEIGPSIVVPFVGGLDTKTDSKITPMGKLQVLENGIFTEGSSIKKRWGYDAMLPVSLTGSEVDRVRSLSQWNNTPVLTAAYDLYVDVGGKWANEGSFPSLSAEEVTVPHSVGEQSMGDCISNGTITVYAWEDSRGGVRASVVDATSGAIHSHDVLVDSGGSRPRCSLVGSTVIVFYVDVAGNQVFAVPINNGDPATDIAATPVEITNDLDGYTYDVHHEYGRTFLSWISSTASEGLKTIEVNSAGAASNAVEVDIATDYVLTASNIVFLSMSVVTNPGDEDRIAIVGVTSNGGKGFIQLLHADAFSNASGSAYITSVRSTINAMSVYPALGESAVSHEFLISYEVDASSDEDNYVVTEDQAGAVWSTIRHCSIASRGRVAGDRGYILLNYTSPGLQNCYFLYDMFDKIPVSRISYGAAGATYSSGQKPGLWTTDGTTIECAVLIRRRISSLGEAFKSGGASNSTFENTQLGRYRFDLSAKAGYVEVGASTYFANGALLSYDGVTVEESAPFLFPEGVTIIDGATPADHGASLTVGATYLYRVYYERIRAGGETTRSLALTYSHTMHASTASHAEITIPMLSHTMAQQEGDLRIAVYRTEANRTQQFYQVTSADLTSLTAPNEYIPNDPTTDSYTFDDDMTDAQLRATGSLDAQSQGVIPVVQPPGCSIIGEANDRVFLAGGEGLKGVIYPSLVHFPGEPLLFSDELQFSVEENGGEITAMSAIDGVLIVFKERRVYAVSGDGLSDTGSGQPFNVQRVTTDVGCSNPGSVVEYPEGLMFQSAKGMYSLDRSFRTQYIGWPVEGIDDGVVVSAEVIPDTNLVVFLMTSGKTLAYDYVFNQWTSFTGHNGLDAIVIGGDYKYLRSDGEVYTRNKDLYLDAGSWYALRLRTAPIRLSSVQDYLSVRRVNILGEYLSSHRLHMLVWCNRDLAPFESRIFEVDSIVDTTEWGDVDVDQWDLIDTTPWGGEAGESDYQFQHKFKRQTVQSIRLEFKDLRTDGAPGQSYELAEMNFEIATHEGNARVPARRK